VGFVNTFGLGDTPFVSEEAEDSNSKGRVRLGKAQVFVNGRVSAVNRDEWAVSSVNVDIDGEPKNATKGGNAADNVGIVDGAAVPSVCCALRSFDKDGCSAAAMVTALLR